MSQTALWTLGLLGVLVLAFLCVTFNGPRIEADLTSQATAALASVGGITPEMDGRTLTLRGTVPDEAARDRALEEARGIPGVARVIDGLTIAGGAAVPSIEAPVFSVERDGGDLVVRGRVPDDATREAVLAQVEAAYPGQTIRDELTVDAEADGRWSGSLNGLLPAMAPVADGSVRIEGTTVVIRGTVPTEAARAEIEAAVRAALPDGFTLRNDLTIAEGSGDEADASADQIEGSGSDDADMQSAEAALGEALSIGQIEFESGTMTLTAQSREILDRAAAVFTAYPILGAEVQGHTDSQGGDAANRALSQRRAEAVRDYLVNQGVDTDALTPQGYGEAEPIADNDTAEGRARNRRVVFSLRAR